MVFKEIDLSVLTDAEVLFFIRIRGRDSYFESVYSSKLLAEFKSIKMFRTISEYAKDADIHVKLEDVNPHGATIEEREIAAACVDEFDVIRRCRGLRNISYVEASELIARCSLFFIRLFRGSCLKLIVSGAIDNYVMDIMERMAAHYGIKMLGVTEFLLAPKFKFVTIRGEHTEFRIPSDMEVDEVGRALRTRLLSSLAIPKSRAIKNAIYDFLSYYYRYVVRYAIGYKLFGKLAYEYRFAPFFRKFHSLRNLRGPSYFRPLSALDKVDCANAVYVPLHFTPEASVDYWVKDAADVNYLASVIRVIRSLEAQGHVVVLKEHPYCYLARQPDFYQQIESASKALILDPFVPSRYVFQRIRRIVVWTGSSGVEAAVTGLNVRIVTENYYSDGQFKLYTDADVGPLTEEQQSKLVRRVLSTSLVIE